MMFGDIEMLTPRALRSRPVRGESCNGGAKISQLGARERNVKHIP
jgi:hypothetical protein